MQGKVILVTGANSGIGKATATGLAHMGATVVMVSRTEKRGTKAQRDVVKQTGNESVDLIVADLSTTAGIHGLADAFRARRNRLDVLINNAAVLTSSRRLTPEGFEMQFFVNHLAYFLLTGLLLDTLRASAPSRIINVTSTAHSSGTIDFDNLQGESGYQGYQAYANSKLANMVFTYELARRLEGTGVAANCVHPGIIHTNLLRNYSGVLHFLFNAFQMFFKKPDEGAETPVYLASSPEVEGVTGKYFKYKNTLGSSEESYDRDVQRRLWEVSEEMTGFRYDI